MNCRFLLINFFLTWRLRYTYNALIFKFNQLFGLYQYVCRACCNCKIIFLFIFYNLMADLVKNFFHLRNSCFIFCRNLYTHFVHEMIVEPGTKASAGSQADDHVSHLLHQNTMYWGIIWFYFRGRVSRINVIFGSKIKHTCINRFICLKLWMHIVHVYTKVLQLSDFKFNFFHIWFVKYVLMNLLGLIKLSKLIPMSIYKKFQTA